MKKVKLENVDIGLEEKLKDKEFKRLYELERVRVALAQRIPAKLLQNLVYRSGSLKATIKEGVAALKPYAKDLEAIHIRIDYPYPSTLTLGFGSNFDLDKRLYREIQKKGLYWK